MLALCKDLLSARHHVHVNSLILLMSATRIRPRCISQDWRTNRDLRFDLSEVGAKHVGHGVSVGCDFFYRSLSV